LCSIDSSDVDARSTPLKECHHRSLWSLQITLTGGTQLIFLAIRGWKIAGMGGRGLNPQPLYLFSQSGAYDLSATVIPVTALDYLVLPACERLKLENLYYHSIHSIQVFLFIFFWCFNVYVQSLLHSYLSHFKTGFRLFLIPASFGIISIRCILDPTINKYQYHWLTTLTTFLIGSFTLLRVSVPNMNRNNPSNFERKFWPKPDSNSITEIIPRICLFHSLTIAVFMHDWLTSYLNIFC